MSTPIIATYVDTCLSCYLQDSYSRPGQTLCLAPLGGSLADTVESLFDSIDCDSGIPEEVSDVAICRALRESLLCRSDFGTLQTIDLRAVDAEGNRVDDDEETDDDCGDEVYIYVVLEWNAYAKQDEIMRDIISGPLLRC